jgi:lipopolysaccharide biosynthesis regulator YciM
LANLYKSRGEYFKAIAIWEKVLATEQDSGARERAQSQIQILKKLTASPRKRAGL